MTRRNALALRISLALIGLGGALAFVQAHEGHEALEAQGIKPDDEGRREAARHGTGTKAHERRHQDTGGEQENQNVVKHFGFSQSVSPERIGRRDARG